MTAANCQIRLALATDIERVVALERTMETVPHWAIADYLAALTPVEHESQEAGTRRGFFVACSGEEIVGFAVGRVTALEAEVIAELESVGVADSVRRNGVGRRLCDAVIRWADKHGAGEMELEVRSRSEGAIALYRRLGFSAVGVRAGYYRAPVDDAVLMRLMLTEDPGVSAEADSLRE